MKFADPFKILTPSERWAPTQDQMDDFQNAYEKLLPPLVYKIRLAVAKWKDEDYKGASETSKALMNFWFNQEHLIGQNIKVTKDKNGIIERTTLTENWHDWIDYWAIDFNYEDKKEVIKIKNNEGKTEEKWTGNYLFENEWQSFRTKKNPSLEFTSTTHEYPQKGKYKIMVKVVDILGIDTSKIIEVQV